MTPCKKCFEIADVIRGVSFNKDEVFDEPTKDCLPVLRAGNIDEYLDLNNNLIWVKVSKIASIQKLQYGDVVMATSSGSEKIVGKSAQLLETWPGSAGAFCVIIRFNPKYILPKFGAYWFKGPYYTQWRSSQCLGANIKNLRKSDIESIEIPLPSLAEQERIVRLLDTADELRQLRAQADRRSADLIPALFHDMFGDPATNPKRWQIAFVGELIELCEYGSSKKTNENNDNTGYPMLRMNNITYDGRLDLSDLKTVEMEIPEYNKYRLLPGDVLFNRTNSRELVGKTGMWDGRMEAVAASYFIRLRFNIERELPVHFTTYMNLSYMKTKLAQMARGAVGQANINSKELLGIQIPVPPSDLQNKYVARVAEIRALEEKQAASRQHLDALFQSLLHRAFNGELTAAEFAPIKLSAAAKSPLYKQEAVLAYIVNYYHSKKSKCGRVKLAKSIYFAQNHAGVQLDGVFKREVAGPLLDHLEKREQTAEKAGWISITKPDRGADAPGAYEYAPGDNVTKALTDAIAVIGDKRPEFDRILDQLSPLDTRTAELAATIHAILSEFNKSGTPPTDDDIVVAVHAWHKSKKKFSSREIQSAHEWLRMNLLGE